MTNSDYQNAYKKLEYLTEKIQNESFSFFPSDEHVKVKAAALILDEKYKNHYEYIDALYDVLDTIRHSNDDILLK